MLHLNLLKIFGAHLYQSHLLRYHEAKVDSPVLMYLRLACLLHLSRCNTAFVLHQEDVWLTVLRQGILETHLVQEVLLLFDILLDLFITHLVEVFLYRYLGCNDPVCAMLVVLEHLWWVEDQRVEELVLPLIESIQDGIITIVGVQSPVESDVLLVVGLTLELEDLHLEERQCGDMAVLLVLLAIDGSHDQLAVV